MKLMLSRARAVLAAALSLLLLTVAANAAITVTSTADSGPGTLRQAIADAGAGETIDFAPGLGNQTITLTSAPLTIDKNLTIVGPLGAPVGVSGNHERRVFVVEAGVTSAILNRLIIKDGRFLNTSNVAVVGGAGIHNKGILTVIDSTVTGNVVVGSPGVYNYGGGIFNARTLLVANTTVSNNSVSGPTVNRGGGITNYIDADLTIATSTISNNETNGGSGSGNDGAGVANEGGTVHIINSTITANTCTAAPGGDNNGGGTGAGLFNNGDGTGADVVIIDSAITNNTIHGPGFAAGGGISNANGATITIARSTISGNSVNGNGGGGGIMAQAPLTIIDSTISNNASHTVGGGIWMAGAHEVTLTNSTLSGNTVSGGNNPNGGGITNYGATLNLIGSTISGNSVSGGSITPGSGGGVHNVFNNGAVNARNTIIGGNSAPASPDFAGPLTSRGHNLIGNTAGATIDGDVTGNVLNQEPKLGPLADNGGPTRTMRLLGGPALNRGTDVTVLTAPLTPADTTVSLADASAFPPGVSIVLQVDAEQMAVTGRSGNNLTVDRGINGTTATSHDAGAAVNPVFDQRGSPFLRKSGSAPDIGAFELQSTVVTSTADSGAGSLRDAIAAAPSEDEAITFEIPTNDPNYDSSTAAYTITLGSALPDLPNVSVFGPGANIVTVRRNPAASEFRIFNVPSGQSAVIAGLTITGGKAPENTSGGGGLLNQGTLSIDQCVISGNSADFGAGISNFALTGTSTLTVTNSIVSGNSTAGNGLKAGGGICNHAQNATALATLTVANSTISGNSGGSGGGGLLNRSENSDSTANATITNSTISGNSSRAGGGMLNWAQNGGSTATAILTNITVSRNYGDFGGGLENYAQSSGSSASATIVSSTITANSCLFSGNGGGIFQTIGDQGSMGRTMLRNTITAGNFRTSGGGGSVVDDVGGTLDAASSHNLLGTGGSGGLTNGTNNNKIVANPLLAPLGDYGGPTETHALLPGSLAINAGTSTGAPATDQRGVGRVGAVDVGAFESRGFTISATSGGGQSAPINSAFAAPLVATVTSMFGEPVEGGAVTFTAPGSGPSASFSGSNPFAATIASGGAAGATATANATTGGYTVTADANGVSGTATFNLQNEKRDQTITFAELPNKTFGDPDFTLSASASSGLPVSFTASGNCTMPNANTVHITRAGPCSITASQAGNDSYNAAPSVTRFFTILRANQTISFGDLPDRTYGDAPFTLSATSSSGLPVAFHISGPATLSGNTVTLTGAGAVTVTASQDGNENYDSASHVARSFTVAKAPTTLAVTSSQNPAKAGKVVTFTATLSSSVTGDATGTVLFKVNGSSIGNPQPLGSGRTASFSTDALPPGDHAITAEYSGDANLAPSTGTLPDVQVINPPPSQPLNVSTRLNVLTGENVLIGGFFITGNAPKKVIIRAIGPSLTADGATLAGRLVDPTLEVFNGTTGDLVATNDNWKMNPATGESQQAEVEATTVPPTNDLESAVVRTLSPGPYTAIVSGRNGGTGIALVEVFDLDTAADSRFANISTRGFVDTGNNVMIGGFILGGTNAGSSVLVRGIGPSLADSGVGNALQDPRLELYNADGEIVAANDDWKTDEATGESQQSAIETTTIPPANDRESAILITLQPGAYTAVLAGKGGATGVGLVELYNLR